TFYLIRPPGCKIPRMRGSITGKTARYAAVLVALTLTWVAGPDAQRRGGGPPDGAPGGGRGRGAAAAAGTIERVVVRGKSLEGNREGDSPGREALGSLPPAYATDPERRFPVVYLLHGYGGREDTFTERLGRLAESADRLSRSQGYSQVIVVTPSAYTLHK